MVIEILALPAMNEPRQGAAYEPGIPGNFSPHIRMIFHQSPPETAIQRKLNDAASNKDGERHESNGEHGNP
ncbi:MAG: hypothetical protein R3C08_08210 [Hyphomonas sp.]